MQDLLCLWEYRSMSTFTSLIFPWISVLFLEPRFTVTSPYPLFCAAGFPLLAVFALPNRSVICWRSGLCHVLERDAAGSTELSLRCLAGSFYTSGVRGQLLTRSSRAQNVRAHVGSLAPTRVPPSPGRTLSLLRDTPSGVSGYGLALGPLLSEVDVCSTAKPFAFRPRGHLCLGRTRPSACCGSAGTRVPSWPTRSSPAFGASRLLAPLWVSWRSVQISHSPTSFSAPFHCRALIEKSVPLRKGKGRTCRRFEWETPGFPPILVPYVGTVATVVASPGRARASPSLNYACLLQRVCQARRPQTLTPDGTRSCQCWPRP